MLRLPPDNLKFDCETSNHVAFVKTLLAQRAMQDRIKKQLTVVPARYTFNTEL